MSLKIGDKVPAFRSLDVEGKQFDSTGIIGKKITVIYFYPRNFTPGCTKEACHFRDSYQVFRKLGVEVIGVSSDTVGSHKKFKEHYALPFILLSDPDQNLRVLFGVKNHLLGLIPGRETLIIDKNGILCHRFRRLRAGGHHERALTCIRDEIYE